MEQEGATLIGRVGRGCLARRRHQAMLRSPISVIVLLGGPGSGKSTYSSRLVHDFEAVHHVSIGDLLRQACSGPTAFQHKQAESIRAMMEDGEHVSNEIVVDVMVKEIQRLRFRRSHDGLSPPVVLLDNFPLSTAQRLVWEAEPHLPAFSGVLFLDCPEEVMIQRVVERAQSTKRSDDNEATVATAIARYNETCKAEVVSHYESLNQCTRISAGGDVDEGYQQSRDALLQLCGSDYLGSARTLAAFAELEVEEKAAA